MKEANKPARNPQQASPNPLAWLRWAPLALLLGLLVYGLFVAGRIIVVPLIFSLAIAYALAPCVVWFERRGWSRSTAVFLTLIAAALLFTLVLIFVLPSIWEQLRHSYAYAQEMFANRQKAAPLLGRLRQISPPVYDFVSERLQSMESQMNARALLANWLQQGFFQLVNLTTSFFDLLLIPFFIYYALNDYPVVKERIDRLVPPRFRPLTSEFIRQFNWIISSYVRSQLLIAFVMGSLYALGLALLRVPLAVTIGMLAGLLNFLPYVGTLTGLVLSFLLLALDGAGVARLLGLLPVFIIVQSIEGYYLTPKLLGDRLNLHPLLVLMGLVIGGNLFGLLGIILAVPVIAIAKVILGFAEQHYRQSAFYQGASPRILTEDWSIADFTQAGQPTAPLLVAPTDDYPAKAPRTIITSSEIGSRKRDTPPPASE